MPSFVERTSLQYYPQDSKNLYVTTAYLLPFIKFGMMDYYLSPLTAIMKDQVLDTVFALVLLLFSCTLHHLRQPAPPANTKTVVLTLRLCA